MGKLYDMHCHLDFAVDCKAVAMDASSRIAAVDSTVTPADYVIACEHFEEFPDIHEALGMHPWWVADGRITEADVARFESLAPLAGCIGEIGLDFHGQKRKSKPRQMEVFARALEAIAAAGSGKVVFLHVVKAFEETNSLMERFGTLSGNTVVFHWFQGTRGNLDTAVEAGCLFSVGPRMLATPKGCEVASAIPEDRLLLETDAPSSPASPWSASQWMSMLEEATVALAKARGVKPERIEAITASNSMRLLQEHDLLDTGA